MREAVRLLRFRCAPSFVLRALRPSPGYAFQTLYVVLVPCWNSHLRAAPECNRLVLETV